MKRIVQLPAGNICISALADLDDALQMLRVDLNQRVVHVVNMLGAPIALSRGGVVWSCPVDDNPAGLHEMELAYLRRLLLRIPSGDPAVTVCAMGQNRSGLAAAILYAQRMSRSHVEAMWVVQAASPGPEHPLLWNPGFQRQLQELDERYPA